MNVVLGLVLTLPSVLAMLVCSWVLVVVLICVAIINVNSAIDSICAVSIRTYSHGTDVGHIQLWSVMSRAMVVVGVVVEGGGVI